ncbi:hypothetical protein JCM10914A_40010 [Paenibacillus sp. JCM 10914]|uniref:hypothetical protein n=1 Tax=Paenibacillus sp. JCM 10914 TaxID=1236974 RepID=UPI0003CCB1D9|nr:hypothetical protein [Paenibacillus sp. JCM 10914]GAE04727.1 hypothetical protein JCM10914_783 [Paenibacillus sp. JCM 10914]
MVKNLYYLLYIALFVGTCLFMVHTYASPVLSDPGSEPRISIMEQDPQQKRF